MFTHYDWRTMTEKEKLKAIDPILNNLKEVILSDKSLGFSFSADFEETPDIRNGRNEWVSIPCPVTDVFTFNITRIKNN